jgi:lipid-binding SYLF domain-containing protein
MKRTLIFVSMLLAAAFAGCTVAPRRRESRAVLAAEVKEAIAALKAKDPTIERFFNKSYGYAVLPKVFKGAFWLGGAYGRGQVYERSRMLGYCSMSQATLGFSFGGEYFREIIFFREKTDLHRFLREEFTFSAQVSGVALTAGAAAKADYKDGMAVFVLPHKGLMVDASLGGQKFSVVPKAVSQ